VRTERQKDSSGTRETPTPFRVLGNLACLDLVNTEAISEGAPVNLLGGFGDLLAWLEAASLLTDQERRRAAERWEGTSAGRAIFREAIALRGALRTSAERLTAGKSAPADAVAAINRVLASRPAYRQLVRRGSGLVSRTQSVEETALHLLVPVAESAAWLLEHGDRMLLRRCGNPRCILYFYDTTKNARRRWCSMARCGSRAKAAAYYLRNRQG
jgi:predicted RNA-binding Zn ribbon-like protein